MYTEVTGEFNMMKTTKKKFRFDISIWVAASVIAVLAVISAMMTLAHFQQQKA